MGTEDRIYIRLAEMHLLWPSVNGPVLTNLIAIQTVKIN